MGFGSGCLGRYAWVGAVRENYQARVAFEFGRLFKTSAPYSARLPPTHRSRAL